MDRIYAYVQRLEMTVGRIEELFEKITGEAMPSLPAFHSLYGSAISRSTDFTSGVHDAPIRIGVILREVAILPIGGKGREG